MAHTTSTSHTLYFVRSVRLANQPTYTSASCDDSPKCMIPSFTTFAISSQRRRFKASRLLHCLRLTCFSWGGSKNLLESFPVEGNFGDFEGDHWTWAVFRGILIKASDCTIHPNLNLPTSFSHKSREIMRSSYSDSPWWMISGRIQPPLSRPRLAGPAMCSALMCILLCDSVSSFEFSDGTSYRPTPTCMSNPPHFFGRSK